MSKELQALNDQSKLALWAERVTTCKNSGPTVKDWCTENSICEQTYYRWQRRLYALARAQQEIQFAEIIRPSPAHTGNVAVTVRLCGAEADIYAGADSATVEAVLRILSVC